MDRLNQFSVGQMKNSGTRVFNVNTNHPLIPNAQEYMYYSKFVSIHSEDRDIKKFPNSSSFEIELPEDLLNVSSIRLTNWTFPANYDTFSRPNKNLNMTFKINLPYNPADHNNSDLLTYHIFKCLFLSVNQNFLVTIQEGFYNPTQMVTELTNKFNYVVSQRIKQYLIDNGLDTLLTEFIQLGGYTNFVIVYNVVSQKIWFGNRADGFILTNTNILKTDFLITNFTCNGGDVLPDFNNWGLPGNLGLPRADVPSVNGASISDITDLQTINGIITPRFFYGDVYPGDNGYWLLPNQLLPGSTVHWIECLYKINLMGPSNIYMEIEGQNCIDETSPYNISNFTTKTNENNGVYNASFAKIPIPTTPISQWFDRDSKPYKFYIPAAERIRRLKIKIRYHNGQLVNFGVFDYSFMLEFKLLLPQQARTLNPVYGADTVGAF